MVILFLVIFRIDSKFQNEIPKQIWSYWDSDEIPNIVQKCIGSWQKTNPDYQINVLSKKTVSNYVTPPPGFEYFPPQKQSDWTRLAVINEYGGVWLDASTIITGPLAWINGFGKDTVLYYIDANSPDKNYLNVENWFMASVPKGKFISAWFEEFNYSIHKFKEKGSLHYEEIKSKFGSDIANGAGSMIHHSDYYDQHISVQKIMKGDKVSMETVELLKAEDGPLYHGSISKDPGWRYIIRDNDNEFLPPIIKLIGHERREIENTKYKVHPNSIYKKYLE
jgi:hypothetical protein